MLHASETLSVYLNASFAVSAVRFHIAATGAFSSDTSASESDAHNAIVHVDLERYASADVAKVASSKSGGVVEVRCDGRDSGETSGPQRFSGSLTGSLVRVTMPGTYASTFSAGAASGDDHTYRVCALDILARPDPRIGLQSTEVIRSGHVQSTGTPFAFAGFNQSVTGFIRIAAVQADSGESNITNFDMTA